MKVFRKEVNRFNYTPRYYKGEGNPYKFKGKFDEFRAPSAGTPKSGLAGVLSNNIKGKFAVAMNDFKSSGSGVNKTILIIILILTFMFLYIIDFDLSIFTEKKSIY